MKIERSDVVSFFGVIISFSLCYWPGYKINFHDQWLLYDALRNTSAIIFAVIGAWITIIYPEALRQIFKRNIKYEGEGADSVRLLVSNIRISTFILAGILVLGIVSQIVRHLDYFQQYALILRSISFGILGAFTFLQIWTLLLTIGQAEIANTAINHLEVERHERNSLTSQVRFKSKNSSQ